MIDKIKYGLTKLAPSSIYRQLPLGRTHADIVASKLSAGKGGVVPERVAGEDAAAAPDINVTHCHGDPERPAAEFSPGKDPALDLRDGLVSPVAYYIRDINGNWQRGVEAFMQIGRLCAEANTHLTTAQKRQLIEALPFGDTAFSKFVRIGTDTRLQTPHIQRLLPVHYTTTYAVTLLTDEELKQAIADNVLHPDMTRAQLQRWRNSHREKAVVVPPSEAVSDTAVADLGTTATRDADENGALSSTRDDNRDDRQFSVAPEDLRAPTVAIAAETKGPLTPPPGEDDIPAFLDRRPLSLEDQRAFDAIISALNAASPVVRERVRAELVRAMAGSGSVAGRKQPAAGR